MNNDLRQVSEIVGSLNRITVHVLCCSLGISVFDDVYEPYTVDGRSRLSPEGIVNVAPTSDFVNKLPIGLRQCCVVKFKLVCFNMPICPGRISF